MHIAGNSPTGPRIRYQQQHQEARPVTQKVAIAAALVVAIAAFIVAAIRIDHDPNAALADPNLETIKYIGREHPDVRFKFADRPAPAAAAQPNR